MAYSATYNPLTGILTLSSAGQTASNSQWQSVFDAITFTTTSANTQNRSITFVVNDGYANSNSLTKGVSIIEPVNRSAGESVYLQNDLSSGSSAFVATTIASDPLGDTNLQGFKVAAGGSNTFTFYTGTDPSNLGVTAPVTFVGGSTDFSGGLSALVQESNGPASQASVKDSINKQASLIFNLPGNFSASALQDAIKPLGGDANTKLNYLSITVQSDYPLIVPRGDQTYNGSINILNVALSSTAQGTLDLSSYNGIALISGHVTVNGVGPQNQVIDAGNGAIFNFQNGGTSIVIAQGGSTINGGDGLDTVILSSKPSSGAHLTTDTNGVTHITLPSQGSTDLTGVERIQFSDGTLALDTGPTSPVRTAYSLYSLLVRTPDKEGLGYWISNLETGAINLQESIIAVLSSSEYSSAHPGTTASSIANTDNVTALYRDLLDREPDASGLQYWKNTGATLFQIANAFFNSSEYKGLVGTSLNDGVFYTPYNPS